MVFQFSFAPHLELVHKIMIKVAKKSIYAILATVDNNDEELIIALTGAEALINSRRLTNQSMDPNDDVLLTPNHFCTDKLSDNFFFLNSMLLVIYKNFINFKHQTTHNRLHYITCNTRSSLIPLRAHIHTHLHIHNNKRYD